MYNRVVIQIDYIDLGKGVVVFVCDRSRLSYNLILWALRCDQIFTDDSEELL